MTVPAVVLRGVRRTFGTGEAAVHALRGVDLDVAFSEFVVLLGPSGAGKTTLLNIIGAIEPASSGEIQVAGESIGSLSTDAASDYRRRKVGFVFQFFNLVPTLTALENVQLVAELCGGGVQRRSRAALSQVGLAGLADRFPAQMSGGQQQRVAIARAVVKEPPLLLTDEPTGALDLETGRQVLAVLHALAREGHHTVITVTHNAAIAQMADRVLRVHDGRIVDERQIADPIPAQELQW
jgi:putative ABC transport system ATP-binding protein